MVRAFRFLSSFPPSLSPPPPGRLQSRFIRLPDAETLIIISPHGSDIRREFADAFSAWNEKHFGKPVHVIWPDIGGGGTETIIKYLQGSYQSNQSPGFDVVFGGGSATFKRYAANNFLTPIPPMDPREAWLRDPIAAVPADIFKSPLHGTDGAGHDLWTAATMSSFGIVINKDRIAELHLPTPKKWEDISTPQWFGLLSLADPSKSGSVKTSYEMLFQQYGWEDKPKSDLMPVQPGGWTLMTRLFENAALLRDNGGAPADDVGSADAVAGIVIDFYGRLQTVRVGTRIAAYVAPEGGSSLDADPIAMLKGAPSPDLAGRFIRFVLSEEGQKIWVLKAGTSGGPRRSTLGRLSVVEGLYTSRTADLSDPVNPFALQSTLKFDPAASSARSPFIGELIKAALIDNHDALVRARRAIKAAGDPPALLAQLEALPTFRPSHLASGELAFDDPRPIRTADFAAVLAEISPKDPALAERMQNALRDHSRTSFAARFAAVEKAAR